MKYLIYTLIFFLLIGCNVDGADTSGKKATAVDTTALLVHRISSTDRLYTSQYVVHKLVKYDDEKRFENRGLNLSYKLPLGTRKIIIPIDVYIKGYIDFADFSADNVIFSPDSSKVKIILPDPRVVITSTKIDHKGIKSYIDILRKDFSMEEMSEFERQGRNEVAKRIPQMGIVENARLNAYTTLLPLIQTLGFEPENVEIEFRKQFTPEEYQRDIISFIKE